MASVFKVVAFAQVAAQHALVAQAGLLHHARGGDVARKTASFHPVAAAFKEREGGHAARGLGRVALVPVGNAQPVAQAATPVAAGQTQGDRAQQRLVAATHDGPGETDSVIGVSHVARDPGLGRTVGIGMRDGERSRRDFRRAGQRLHQGGVCWRKGPKLQPFGQEGRDRHGSNRPFRVQSVAAASSSVILSAPSQMLWRLSVR